MELPDPIQNFIHPTLGGEEGQSDAALAAGAARDGVAQSPPAMKTGSPVAQEKKGN